MSSSKEHREPTRGFGPKKPKAEQWQKGDRRLKVPMVTPDAHSKARQEVDRRGVARRMALSNESVI
jgi:hypothetical protein